MAEAGGDNPTQEARGNGSYSNDDGTGGYGGGTVNNTKASWSGFDGYINGALNHFCKLSLIRIVPNFNLFYYNTIVKDEDEEDTICLIPCGGGWNSDGSAKGTVYDENTREIVKYFGQNATSRGTYGSQYQDLSGGGAGYYGGECSAFFNSGSGGGSAYADITGVVKAVTDIQGYGGYENGNGAEMKGKYGNGKIIISQ